MLRKSIEIVVVLLAFLFGELVFSDTLDDLLATLEVKDEIAKDLESCRNSSREVMKNEFSFEYQSNRLGLKPDDEDWIVLAEIYDEFYSISCSYISEDETMEIYRDIISKSLDGKDIEKSLNFFSTPVGKKVLSSISEARTVIRKTINEKFGEIAFEAQRIFEKRIEDFWIKRNERQLNDSKNADT